MDSGSILDPSLEGRMIGVRRKVYYYMVYRITAPHKDTDAFTVLDQHPLQWLARVNSDGHKSPFLILHWTEIPEAEYRATREMLDRWDVEANLELKRRGVL